MSDPSDASLIPQPTYGDLYLAFIAGAEEARANPSAHPNIFGKAADAYCKMWHLKQDPEGFRRFHFSKPS